MHRGIFSFLAHGLFSSCGQILVELNPGSYYSIPTGRMSPVCKPRPLHWSRVFLGYSSGTSSLMAVLIFLDRVHLGNGQCSCGNSKVHSIGPDFCVSWLDVASEASGSSLPGSPGKHGITESKSKFSALTCPWPNHTLLVLKIMRYCCQSFITVFKMPRELFNLEQVLCQHVGLVFFIGSVRNLDSYPGRGRCWFMSI